jgi:hypothetical protein
MQHDDDDTKKSEPVTDETGTLVTLKSNPLTLLIYLEAMVSDGNWTVRRSLRAAENTASSNSNLVNHNITTISSSRIVDMDSITTSKNVQPCITPPISMIII